MSDTHLTLNINEQHVFPGMSTVDDKTSNTSINLSLTHNEHASLPPSSKCTTKPLQTGPDIM